MRSVAHTSATATATATAAVTLIRQHHAASLPSALTFPSGLSSPFSTTFVRGLGTGALNANARSHDMLATGTSPKKFHAASLPSALTFPSGLSSPFSTTFIRGPGTCALNANARRHHAASLPSALTLRKSIPIPNRLSSPFSTTTVRGLRSYPHNDSTYNIPSPPINWGGCIVKADQVFVIERFGRYHATLLAGIHFLIPFVDRIAYVYCLKDQAFSIWDGKAVTKDRIPITVEACVVVKVVDPVRASYGIVNPFSMIKELAHSTVRSEIAKITLDDALVQTESLSHKLAETIDGNAKNWGVRCCGFMIRLGGISSQPATSFSIRTISPPKEEGGHSLPGLLKTCAEMVAHAIGLFFFQQQLSGSKHLQATEDKDATG